MALVVCFLWHISEVALDYIRIILALVFLPRVPLRDLPFREKKISPRSAVENTSKRKSSWNNRDIPGKSISKIYLPLLDQYALQAKNV